MRITALQKRHGRRCNNRFTPFSNVSSNSLSFIEETLQKHPLYTFFQGIDPFIKPKYRLFLVKTPYILRHLK